MAGSIRMPKSLAETAALSRYNFNWIFHRTIAALPAECLSPEFLRQYAACNGGRGSSDS